MARIRLSISPLQCAQFTFASRGHSKDTVGGRHPAVSGSYTVEWINSVAMGKFGEQGFGLITQNGHRI